MSVHVLEWDRFLVLGAGWVSFVPRDPSLPGPDRTRQGRIKLSLLATPTRSLQGNWGLPTRAHAPATASPAPASLPCPPGPPLPLRGQREPPGPRRKMAARSPLWAAAALSVLLLALVVAPAGADGGGDGNATRFAFNMSYWTHPSPVHDGEAFHLLFEGEDFVAGDLFQVVDARVVGSCGNWSEPYYAVTTVPALPLCGHTGPCVCSPTRPGSL